MQRFSKTTSAIVVILVLAILATVDFVSVAVFSPATPTSIGPLVDRVLTSQPRISIAGTPEDGSVTGIGQYTRTPEIATLTPPDLSIARLSDPTPLTPGVSPTPTGEPTPTAPVSVPTPLQPIVIPITATLSPIRESAIKPPFTYYWGVWIEGVPFDMSKLTAFEDMTKRRVDIIHWGAPWMTGGAYQPFEAAELDKVLAHGSIPLLAWGSWDSARGVDQPDFHLRDIYAGKHDAFIREWASAAKAWGHPFFLRLDQEMNGWWFPWSEQLNGNQPGDFVKAWRHVHDIFTEVGATNVTWVWNPNATGYWKSTPAYELYPGANYVDWVAMDGFNWGSDYGNSWQTFDEVFRHTYDELRLMAPSKPIMIAETASSENGGPLGKPASKAAWIKDAFAQQLPLYFSKIKAVVWFESIGYDPALSWPIESSQASLDAFLQAIPH